MTTSQDRPLHAAEQRTERPRYLIGPDYYAEYIRLLRLLLVIIVPIIAVLVGMAGAMAGAEPPQAVASALAAAFSVGVQVALWVTVAFAIIERTATGPRAMPSGSTAVSLRERPGNRIGLGETIGSIVGLALLIWVLLWQPGYQATLDAGGPSIPILDPALQSNWVPYFVTVLLGSIILAIVKYRVRHWTVTLATLTTVLDLAFAIPAIWLIAADGLLNPDFVSAVSTGAFAWTTGSVATLIGWVIALVCAIDISSAWWKTLRRTPAAK